MSKSLLADSRLWPGTLGFNKSLTATPRQQPTRVTGLSKSEAEDLLDWLEVNGYREYHLSYGDSRGFTVSFSKQ
jgi:hypothetical protein